MSETGPTGLKGGSPFSGQGTALQNALLQSVDFLALPEELKVQLLKDTGIVKLRGDVAQANDDGSVRVRTARGDITLKIPADIQQKPETRIQTGSKVTLEIAPQAPTTAATGSKSAPNTLPNSGVIQYVPAALSQNAGSVDTPLPLRTTETPVNLALNAPRSDAPAAAYPKNVGQVASPTQFSDNSALRLIPLTQAHLAGLVVTDAEQGTPRSLSPPSASGAAPQSPSEPPAGPRVTQTPTQAPGTPPLNTGQNAPPSSPTPPPQGQAAPIAPAQVREILQQVVQQGTAQPVTATVTRIDTQTAPQTTAQGSAPLSQAQTGLSSDNAQPSTQTGALNPPSASAAAAPAHRDGVTGQIIARTADGAPVVYIPPAAQVATQSTAVPTDDTASMLAALRGQAFVLPVSDSSFPIGVQVNVTPSPTPETQVATASQQQGAISQLLSSAAAQNLWPVMQEIQHALLQVAPQAAQNFAQSMPNPANPTQFGAAVLFFVAAVRSGDVMGWLGDKTAEILRREGHGNLLTRLSSEGATLSRVAAEPLHQDWRAMNIPFYYDGDIQKMALHYKHEREHSEDSEAGGIKGTRFVFDLTFSEIGPVQLDGYFRQKTKDGTRLDVILRSEQPFSQAMHAEMRRLYALALEPTGVEGELSFQNDKDHWLSVKAKKTSSLGVEA